MLKNKIKLFTIFISLFIVSAFIFTSCSNESTSNVTTTTTIEVTTTPPTIMHTLSETSLEMNDDEKETSLDGYGAAGAMNDNDLTITDMLMYAVQDEYLAHGEYLAIVDAFGDQTPYTNIIKAEESHLSFLEQIFTAYDMSFPQDTSDAHLMVPDSLLEAAKTGVQAEIDNIVMYEKFLNYDLPADIRDVFTSLKNGSDSHLLAFQKQVDRLSN